MWYKKYRFRYLYYIKTAELNIFAGHATPDTIGHLSASRQPEPYLPGVVYPFRRRCVYLQLVTPLDTDFSRRDVMAHGFERIGHGFFPT